MENLNRRLLGKNIKYLREKRNINQTELAEFLGVSQNTVSGWENATREPNTIQILLDIAKFFDDISLDKLLYDDLSKDNVITSPTEALKFILEQPIFASNVGYDPKKMTDEQLIKLANRILRFTKMEIEDMDYVDLDELDSLE